ncbi:hypothetical protein [Brevibacillus reuszeri]|uniref:hypothetical protein n=1 Tax=Brevibacillus reuszeri TaxID=54915 RepID=UPI003D22FC93
MKRYALIQMKGNDQYHIWDRYKEVISDPIPEEIIIDDDGQYLTHHTQVTSLLYWKPWSPAHDEFFFRRIWGPLPPKGTDRVIAISDIALSKPMQAKAPKVKDKELASIRFHVELFGQLDQPVLLKPFSNSLVGNLKHYLVAKEAGLKVVPVAFD